MVIAAATEGIAPTTSAPVPTFTARDTVPDEGPLRGILTGLETATQVVAVVLGCDMPLVAPGLLARLAEHASAGASVVAPVYRGRVQGLCSAWRVETAAPLRAARRTACS